MVSSFVIAAAAGDSHALYLTRHITALHSTTELWGIGYNHYGQLGVTNTFNTSQPELIQSYSTPDVGSPITAIAAGADFSLFRKSDGSLWAMGANDHGQLGDGTTNESHVPLQIMSSNVVAMAAGIEHSLFLKSDGSLWACGYNASGAVGDGTNADRHLPAQIESSNVTAIAAGGLHSLFIKSDGSLWGMGNGPGALGLGLPVYVPNRIPSQIVPLTIPVATYTYEGVNNGGFETGDFSDWTTNGNFSPTDNLVSTKSGYVHSGSYGVRLGPFGSPGYLSQTLTTTPRAKYFLSCWLDSLDGETPSEFLVSWNGTTLLDMTNLAATGWTNLQFVVTATDTSTVLKFGFRDDTSYLGFDDVSMVRIVQPDLTGFSFLGTNLVLNGTNGLYGVAYLVLMSTNLAQPLNQWTPVTTNVLGTNDNFTITATNTVSPAVPQRFYILQAQ